MMKLLQPSKTPEEARLALQIQQLQAQLAGMSMVDEFATYARLERQLNKLQIEASTLKSVNRTGALKMRMLITTITHCITGAAMLYLLWIHGSESVLQLPAAALFPLGYLLAVPGCPLGSVSAASWIVVSTSVVRRTATALMR